jgi:hypothetical protein
VTLSVVLSNISIEARKQLPTVTNKVAASDSSPVASSVSATAKKVAADPPTEEAMALYEQSISSQPDRKELCVVLITTTTRRRSVSGGTSKGILSSGFPSTNHSATTTTTHGVRHYRSGKLRLCRLLRSLRNAFELQSLSFNIHHRAQHYIHFSVSYLDSYVVPRKPGSSK